MARFLKVRPEKPGQTVKDMIEALQSERERVVVAAEEFNRRIYLLDKEIAILIEAVREGVLTED